MATLWPFSPNLKSADYAVHREYRTDMIVSRAGKEQRRALRQTPRKRVEFLSSQSGDCLRQLNDLMVTAQSVQLALADRPRFTVLANGIGASSNTAFVDPLPSWIVVGAELVLVDKARQAIRTVNDITAASGGGWTVTFDESEAVAWPSGTRLHASLNGYLDDNLSAIRTSARGILETKIVYHVDPGVEAAEDVGSAAVKFKGRELWLTRPARWLPVTKGFLQEGAASADYGFGKIKRFFPTPFATRIWRATYAGCDFETSDLFRQFFDRMKGRRGEFHMPTFNADLVPTVALTTAGTTMIVEGSAIAAIYNDHPIFRGLAVKLNNGTWLPRQIDDIAAGSGDVSTITLSTAWGQDVALADIEMVCWMPLWRFASDIMTTVWHRYDRATVSMSFQMIETLGLEPVAEATATIDISMSAVSRIITTWSATGTAALNVNMAASAAQIFAATATASISISAAADATVDSGVLQGSGTAAFDVDMGGDATRLAVGAATAAIDVDMSAAASGQFAATATAAITVGLSGNATIPGGAAGEPIGGLLLTITKAS